MARHEVSTRRLLYEIPGMESVRVRHEEFAGADGAPLAMAVYQPPAPPAEPAPVVVILEGYPDPGFAERLGCRFMDMAWTISLAQVLAASGFTAITHANRAPVPDAAALLAHVRSSTPARVGLWATSGHAPVALSVLRDADCAVLSNPLIGEHAGDIAPGKPLFVVRSGNDATPGLNASLDAFVSQALAADQPITLVNLPGAPHSYDLFHAHVDTGRTIAAALAFLREQLHT